MDKKRGLVILIFLILLLGVVNAAWILSYKKTITGNVFGGKFFTISKEFSNEISIDTSEGADSDTTEMKINVKKDSNVSLDVDIERINMDSSDCPYLEDCRVIVIHNYQDSSDVLMNTTAKSSPSSERFILFKDTENIIRYMISCKENSCLQRIVSNVTIEGI